MLRTRARRNQKRLIKALALAGFLLIAGVSLSPHLRNWIEPTAQAATFTVNAVDDHNDGTCNVADCTLREAINAVNAGSGGDTISFSIAGAGVHTINLTSALPTLNKTVTIDGTSQPGFSGTPLIELNGAGAGVGAYGLAFPSAPNATVKGLIINRFDGYGISVDSFGGLVVQGCYIGTNATGTAAAPNGAGGIRVNVSGVTIGGTSAAARNVISGNTGDGIDIVSGAVTVRGNFIGTNATGTAAVPNTVNGIVISGGSGTIGGTAAGAGNVISGNNSANFPAGFGIYITGGNGSQVQGNFIGTNSAGTGKIPNQFGININGAANNIIGGTTAAARNIISGNTVLGIEIANAGATNNLVQGNFIGPDVNGTAALGNGNGVSGDGIDVGQIGTSPSNVTIGGTTPGAGNVISGNSFEGILLFNDLNGVNVQGNLIGTDLTGHVALGSQRVGIFINTTSPGAGTIGGTTAAARNIISGNGDGFDLNTFSTGITIQGNYIGTDITGSAALPNTFRGMFVSTNSTVIGGVAAGAGNVISGNGGDGIEFANSVTGNLVQGNFIGTAADGVNPLGNASNGVNIFTGASGNTVGGVAAAAGNKIAFNKVGVRVDTGTGNAILGNSIFSNTNLGIDLTPTGVTPNDNCDGDTGPNDLQNFPVLTSAALDPVNTTISGTLNSTANTTFRIEFFSNTVCDPSGNGEGQVFLGSTSVTTNGSCTANIGFVVPNASVSGQYITATATDANNNTSEFSACTRGTTTNAVIQFSAPNYNVGEGDGSVTITVNRSVDTSAFSSIDFATGNNEYRPCTPGDPQNLAGVATQNCDFIRNQGTLVFNPGDTSKTFTVLIVDDGHVEGTETFPVTLSNLVGGPPAVIPPATVTIADNDTSQATSPAPFRFWGVFTGAQETPPNNSNGTGIGAVLLNSSDLTMGQTGLQFSNLSSTETTAHIHGPGAPGVAAPIIFPLPTTNPVVNFQINGITAQQLSDIRSGLDYMNVHSQNFSNGEIRGQLLWNPTLEVGFFVRQHYLDFLQREPDPGGFSFWTGQISQCVADVQCFHDKSVSVSNAFFYELEYQQTGAYTYRLFRAAFGNTQPQPNSDPSNPTEANKIPSYDAYAALRARVVGGANLTAGQQDAANVFVNSSQFLARYPASQPLDQFVDAILNTIMTDIGANLTSQRTALIALGSRAAVVYRLANDDLQGGNGGINNRAFIDAEYNRAFVVTQYFGYLRRDGDIGGLLFWKGQVDSAPLRNVAKQNAMVCSFITSAEYQLRFGPKVPRTNNECPQ
jgi:CSLREA domain-containing protein